jgi:hypothetical protein
MITVSVIAAVVVLIVFDELRRSRRNDMHWKQADELRRRRRLDTDARASCGDRSTTGRVQ